MAGSNAEAVDHHELKVDLAVDGDQPRSVTASGADIAALKAGPDFQSRVRTAFRIRVDQATLDDACDLPSVAGRYELGNGAIMFVPDFTFAPGVTYLAVFDPRPFDLASGAEPISIRFAGSKASGSVAARVTEIHPSLPRLPENILRFYVRFSRPMRRGGSQAAVRLLDQGGRPVEDALYRAPVELWDPSMRWLTVLLDPGRLKRGVGPNRELGPPLSSGNAYTLEIGRGLTDIDGVDVAETASTTFVASDPVRHRVDPASWSIEIPDADSCEPLTIRFPNPMDLALLAESLSVEIDGVSVPAASINVGGLHWTIIPASPWRPSTYRIQISAPIEDVCGNGLADAFDRALRNDVSLCTEAARQAITFTPR